MRTLLIIFLMTLTACNPLKLQAPACQNKNEPGETCTKMVSLKTMQENLLKNKENNSIQEEIENHDQNEKNKDIQIIERDGVIYYE